MDPGGIDRRSILAGAGAAAFAGAARAQAGGGLDANALREDARILRRAWETLHPGLMRYNTAADIDRIFAEVQARFSEPASLGEAYLVFARAAAAVRCGHTFPNPNNAEGAPLGLISDGRDRLPFHFAWIDGRMVVLDDAPDLPRGTEILAIGGVAPDRILARLLPLGSIDGHNETKRVRLMEVRGEERWDLFDVYFPLVQPRLAAGGLARLRVRTPAGLVRDVEAPLIDRPARLAQLKRGVETKGSSAPAWSLERLPGGVGWITMRSWALYDGKWDWRMALDADLDALAEEKARALVIDLRGNGGGLDCGDVILERVARRDVAKPAGARFTRYRRTPDDLNPFLSTWDKSFRDWGDKAVGPDGRGFYRLAGAAGDDEAPVIRPRGRRFAGKLIVLIDAANSSATFQFAQNAQADGLATLVGQPTGGNRRGINGGAFFFLKLPNSGIEIDLPLIATFPDTPQPDAGILPDIQIAPTIQDVARGADPVRERALVLARA